MSFSTCPVATVNAPVDQVWRLLADPGQYDSWWEVRTRSIVPEGPAQPGQQIVAQTSALGRHWDVVHLTVQAIEPEKRQLDLLTRLPFGISLRNHITCQPLDSKHTRVSFG
jgi:polyketide cyclase/dehydrase/lipid transport protein